MTATAFPRFASVDLSGASGRALVAGDIHGCFAELEKALSDLAFDPETDTLFLLGDLVDRGPQSPAAADWLHWPRVRGNHEEMAWLAATDGGRAVTFHRDNGGRWFDALSSERQHSFATALMAAPLAIELVTPAGHRVGLVHADVDGDDWPAFAAALCDPENRRAADVAIWGRTRFDHLGFDSQPWILGIDHVFFGHNVVRTVEMAGNCSWIDTGAGTGTSWGRPTVIDIDAHLSAVGN
jgi:serine/threonine protein phosphatase 1